MGLARNRKCRRFSGTGDGELCTSREAGAMLHSMQKRGHIARLSASFWEILEINSFFKNTDNFLSMSCSNNINPWTTSIHSLDLQDRNYYLQAPLWFLTETEIVKYGTQSAGRWAHCSQLKVWWEQGRLRSGISHASASSKLKSVISNIHRSLSSVVNFPKVKERKRERHGGGTDQRQRNDSNVQAQPTLRQLNHQLRKL